MVGGFASRARNLRAAGAVAEVMGALELSLLIASTILLATMWTALVVVAQGRKVRVGRAPVAAAAEAAG